MSQIEAKDMTAGVLLASYEFMVPQYQRGYSWGEDQYKDFWSDLTKSHDGDYYFLGMIVLSEPDLEKKNKNLEAICKDIYSRKQVVDGQQRMITFSLLTAAIYRKALEIGRNQLANRVYSDFMKAIDYETDQVKPKIFLVDEKENFVFQSIIDGKEIQSIENDIAGDNRGGVRNMINAFIFFKKSLDDYLLGDDFKKLGSWVEFLKSNLYFVVFKHPNTASAYKAFEILNNRGLDLSIVDLLKNFVLGKSGINHDEVYEKWKNIVYEIGYYGDGVVTQFIRHVLTLSKGYILPSELYAAIENDENFDSLNFVNDLESKLPNYLQMLDPARGGPAEEAELKYYSSFKYLDLVSIRALLLALHHRGDKYIILEELLKISVKRMSSGVFGTGNVERKISDLARMVSADNHIREILSKLSELNYSNEYFIKNISGDRRLKKNLITYLRKSFLLGETLVDPDDAVVVYISEKDSLNVSEGLKYSIGNTLLLNSNKNVKSLYLQNVGNGVLPSYEEIDILNRIGDWSDSDVEYYNNIIIQKISKIWS